MSEPAGARAPLFDAGRPLVFAHRGGAGLAPENTLIAFETGLGHGADGLELDVHLSRDGVPVVIHDRTLERTTSGRGLVAEHTAAELAALDAGVAFGAAENYPFRERGHGVPTLADVLERWPDTRVIIELKYGTAALAAAVVQVVRRLGAMHRVCLGSFQQEGLDAARVLAPEIATSASQPEARRTLYRAWVRWPFRVPGPYTAYQVPERAGRMTVVTPSFVRQAHRSGQRVQVWVVDREAQAHRLLDWGVDGLISDRPDLIVSARDAWLRNAGSGHDS
ncbi:MAG: glycerophosphodiester phosphodiesterase [Acidobacteria bacterium]|nr:glycerophosphodiester phosphodiesterase [Acidobacteriota bacterium]